LSHDLLRASFASCVQLSRPIALDAGLDAVPEARRSQYVVKAAAHASTGFS
jgi:hypothetical protein